VTTVELRRKGLLPRTLASLRAAGFDRPRLFVDGANGKLVQSYEDEFRLEVTGRWPRIRAFGNWVLGLAELYIRDPHADRYALFQDDLISYRNLRGYLDACAFPDKGYWNLYTFPQNQVLAPTIDRTGRAYEGWFESNQRGRGAVALVFSREGVHRLLTSYENIIDRPMVAIRGTKNIDGGVVSAMGKMGWKEYVHNPTLIQHTGLVSTLGPNQYKLAQTYRGEDFDALELLKSPNRREATYGTG
jgi:hypothetical protein